MALFLHDYWNPFSILDDPFSLRISPSHYQVHSPRRDGRRHRGADHDDDEDDSPLNFNRMWSAQPAVHLYEDEETKEYVVEAEIPRVRREDLDVKLGDNGRSLKIAGSIVRRPQRQTPSEKPTNDQGQMNDHQVMKSSQSSATAFARTVWLPNPIDAASIKAKLEHGVLTIRAKPASSEAINVTVD
ncbi:hypothetical protein FRC17_000259 [Serendipita sp. 399]|nr:hypothetical protein FRC17_000259 [Serendipita sp. 399]